MILPTHIFWTIRIFRKVKLLGSWLYQDQD